MKEYGVSVYNVNESVKMQMFLVWNKTKGFSKFRGYLGDIGWRLEASGSNLDLFSPLPWLPCSRDDKNNLIKVEHEILQCFLVLI